MSKVSMEVFSIDSNRYLHELGAAQTEADLWSKMALGNLDMWTALLANFPFPLGFER